MAQLDTLSINLHEGRDIGLSYLHRFSQLVNEEFPLFPRLRRLVLFMVDLKSAVLDTIFVNSSLRACELPWRALRNRQDMEKMTRLINLTTLDLSRSYICGRAYREVLNLPKLIELKACALNISSFDAQLELRQGEHLDHDPDRMFFFHAIPSCLPLLQRLALNEGQQLTDQQLRAIGQILAVSSVSVSTVVQFLHQLS